MKRHKKEFLSSPNGTHFGEHQSLCLLNCLKSKNTLKQGKFLKFFKVTAKPKVLGNLKSPGKSWNLESSKGTNPAVGNYGDLSETPGEFFLVVKE